MQMQAQQQLIKIAQEEATTKMTQQLESVDIKVNVLDIKVEEDFDIDEI